MTKKLLFTIISSALLMNIMMAQTDTTKKWTKVYKGNFVTHCIATAKVNVGEDSARWYCNCMATKIEALYPDQNNADKITKADLEKPEMIKVMQSCLIMKWPEADRTKFMADCVKNASSLGDEKAKKYCDCMLVKIELKYPSPKDAETITTEDLTKPEWKKMISDCLK